MLHSFYREWLCRNVKIEIEDYYRSTNKKPTIVVVGKFHKDLNEEIKEVFGLQVIYTEKPCGIQVF
jgi:hypothetical protein